MGAFFRAQAAQATHAHWQIVQLSPTPTAGTLSGGLEIPLPQESVGSGGGVMPVLAGAHAAYVHWCNMLLSQSLVKNIHIYIYSYNNVFAMYKFQHGIRVAAKPNIAVDGLHMLVYITALISWTASLTSRATSVQACSGRGCWRARRCMRCRCACRACSTSTPACRPMRPGHPPRSPWAACACGARCPSGASRCTSTRRALLLVHPWVPEAHTQPASAGNLVCSLTQLWPHSSSPWGMLGSLTLTLVNICMSGALGVHAVQCPAPACALPLLSRGALST